MGMFQESNLEPKKKEEGFKLPEFKAPEPYKPVPNISNYTPSLASKRKAMVKLITEPTT